MSEYPAVLMRTALDYTEHIPPNDIAKSAEDDESGGDDVDQGMCGVIAKAVFRNDVNTGIAKGGNGIEYRDPDTFRTERGDKYEHIQKSAYAFDDKRSEQNVLNEFRKSRHGIEIKSILNKQAIANAHFFVQEKHQS